jgi:hypothetical protein
MHSLLPTLLKAVTDPFSLLSLILATFGWITYSGVRKLSPPTTTGIPIRLIVLAIIAISSLAFTFNSVRVILLQSPPGPWNRGTHINLNVSFSGELKHQETVTVPFNVTSNPIFVDCNSFGSAEVHWDVPQGASNIRFGTSWSNVSGVYGPDQPSARIEGLTIVARGTIHGRERNWIGNCQEGGRAQLNLAGSYDIAQTSSTEIVPLPTFRGAVSPGTAIIVTIPNAPGLSFLKCEISASSNDSDRSTAVFRVEGDTNGWKSVTSVSHAGSRAIEAVLVAQSLSVQVK